MSNQNLPALSDTMRLLYQQFAPQDIEQFYVGYQFLEAEQLALDLQSQISTLQQQIIENIGNVQATQPSALALAALARLQSEGVRDPDLLDYLLLRGEEWLDQTMQRLDYCEQMGLIADNDYTKWCEHALDGAYDWIDSVLEYNESESTGSALSGEEAHEADTSENMPEAQPLDSISGEPATLNTDHVDQTVSEENLLKLLASDGDTEETDLPSPDEFSPSSDSDTAIEPEMQPQLNEVMLELPANEPDAESNSELASEFPTERTLSTSESELPIEAPVPATQADVEIPGKDEDAPSEITPDSALAAIDDDDDVTVKLPQVSVKQAAQTSSRPPKDTQKKGRTSLGIMATLMALKKKHAGRIDPHQTETRAQMQFEEATVELETAEAVGDQLVPTPATHSVPAASTPDTLPRISVPEASTQDTPPDLSEPAASQNNQAEPEHIQEESAPSASESQTTEQGAQPAQENQFFEMTIHSARPPKRHSTTSRRNSPFLMKRALKKTKKRKDSKSRRLTRER